MRKMHVRVQVAMYRYKTAKRRFQPMCRMRQLFEIVRQKRHPLFIGACRETEVEGTARSIQTKFCCRKSIFRGSSQWIIRFIAGANAKTETRKKSSERQRNRHRQSRICKRACSKSSGITKPRAFYEKLHGLSPLRKRVPVRRVEALVI